MVPEFAWPMPVTIEANTIFDQTVPFVPVGTKLDAADQPPLTQMDTCLGQNGS